MDDGKAEKIRQIQKIMKEREAARLKEDYLTSDILRDKLANEYGVMTIDQKNGMGPSGWRFKDGSSKKLPGSLQLSTGNNAETKKEFDVGKKRPRDDKDTELIEPKQVKKDKNEKNNAKLDDKKISKANLDQDRNKKLLNAMLNNSSSSNVRNEQGVLIEIIRKGDDKTNKKASNGSKIKVNYVGRLKSNGKVFDASRKPFAFQLGRGEVIRGWDIGCQGMTIDEVRRLTVPPEKAYGKAGAPPKIPGNATLIFEGVTDYMERTEIISLNNRIASHAKRKELTEAIEIYKQLLDSKSVNSHSFAAILNACVRCNDIDRVDNILKDMTDMKRKRDVIINTTVMKGYCSSGGRYFKKAIELWNDLIMKSSNQINIRTVNTLLRGCVNNGEVELAEIIINQSQKLLKISLDVSSWEYLIILLSQSLQLDKILPIIGRLKDNPEMESGIVNMYLCVTRCASLLKDWKISRKCLQFVTSKLSQQHPDGEKEEMGHQINESSDQLEDDDEVEDKGSSRQVMGGKRSWKVSNSERNESLKIFQNHMKHEMLHEIDLINQYHLHQSTAFNPSSSLKEFQHLFWFYTRILLFNPSVYYTAEANPPVASSSRSSSKNHRKGMNLTVNESCQLNSSQAMVDKVMEDVQKRLGFNKLIQNFTKKNYLEILQIDDGSSITNSSIHPDQNPMIILIKSFKSILQNHFDSSGKVLFHSIFQSAASSTDPTTDPSKGPSRASVGPLKMEIGSGAGEWAIQQALSDPASNWITLELRYDRVYQTFSRAIFQHVPNLCVMGGDALYIFPNHIHDSSISHLFVNYPEPPQQTGGSTTQGQHLLTKEFFIEAERVLVPLGMLTIVTDNLWYGRLLLQILSSCTTSKKKKHPMQSSSGNTNQDSVHRQGFGLQSLGVEYRRHNKKRKGVHSSTESIDTAEWKIHEEVNGFNLFVGNPGPRAGHLAVNASSYFDRLWKRSQLTQRYFIVLQKIE